MTTVIQGDCIEVIKGFESDSFDAIVTDPPYALSFMGKDWDSFGNGKGFQAWCEEWARGCLRVLKPGGHLVAFGGTRTYHREACAIEDAGFEIRDSLHWIYGSGFPKSMDVSKAIDKAAGAEREVTGKLKAPAGNKPGGASYNMSVVGMPDEAYITAPATEAARQWEGFGTALKPAHEPIVLARRPLAEGTVAANVLRYRTGVINVDGCRVPTDDHWEASGVQSGKGASYQGSADGSLNVSVSTTHPGGRWPPNVLLTHSSDCLDWICALDCPVAEVGRQSGKSASVVRKPSGKDSRGKPNVSNMVIRRNDTQERGFTDGGDASRFYPCFRYQAKAPRSERPGVPGVPAHPTVKPVAIMQWLLKLVTPPGGHVLDPFAGTGTTAEAAWIEGFDCTLIERDAGNLKLIEARLNTQKTQGALH